MDIRPSIHPRERILVFGPAGTGKSNALLSIARKCSYANFHIVDNDMAYDRLLATDYTDLENVTLYNVDSDDWEEQLEAATEARAACRPDDWFSFDILTETWAAVQTWFTNKVYGVDDADYFLDLRIRKEAETDPKKKRTSVNMANDDRWTVINKRYKKLQRVLINGQGHVFCTAEVASIGDDDDRDTKNAFGPYGVKPKGQKRTAHLFQTILLLKKTKVGVYTMTTIKDRGRDEYEDLEIGPDFAKEYLMKIAKWKPGVPEGARG